MKLKRELNRGVKHFVQDVCFADDRVSSILTSTSVASLLPFLLPIFTSES